MFNTPHLNPLEWLSALILIVGGLNWGLVGLFEYDLVAQIFGLTFGETNTATSIVYVLVGLSAIYTLIGLVRMEVMTTKSEQTHSTVRR